MAFQSAVVYYFWFADLLLIFQYLRRKMVKSKGTETDEAVSDGKDKKFSLKEDKESQSDNEASNKKKTMLFYVKVRGLPYKAKRKDVREFLRPLHAKAIRIAVKVKCVAYVGFATEKELNQALIKDRSFFSKYSSY